MNKQAQSKLKLFISGVISRFLENENIFLGVTGEYTSGLKNYPFTISYSGAFSLTFQNETVSGEFSSLVNKIIDYSNLYDQIVFTYADRTGCLIIRGDNKNVTVKNDNKVIDFESKSDKKHLISPSKAGKLLSELDFVTDDFKLKNSHTRKYAQAEHFIEILIPYIEKLPAEKEICIYDLACGKSYLSFFLNYYITDVMKRRCRITGLDINESVIESSKKIRDNLKYYNMDFFEANILEYQPETDIDIAISLHACDVATDYAIAAAINNNAKIVAIAPCCHKEFLSDINNQNFDYLFKYGIIKKRFSDLLTDIYRAEVLESKGYDVTMLEFVSPVETPKNLLILAYKNKEYGNSCYQKIEKDFLVNPILNKLTY